MSPLEPGFNGFHLQNRILSISKTTDHGPEEEREGRRDQGASRARWEVGGEEEERRDKGREQVKGEEGEDTRAKCNRMLMVGGGGRWVGGSAGGGTTWQ